MKSVIRSVGVRRALVAAVASASAMLLGLAPSSARAATIDLGQAGGYAVFALDSFQYNGPGSIVGNVAVGQSTNFASPATITGTVFLNNGVQQQGNITPTGGFVTKDLSQAISDATTAASNFDALTPTQTLGTLGNNSSVTGNGGTNVVNVSAIDMSNGTLTLHGSASDIFIINDSGQFKSSNSDIVLSGGVTANHIVFNVSGNVAITGGGPVNFYGTILAPNSDISVHDKNLQGEVIGRTIEDTSGFTINNVKAVPGPSPLIGSAALLATLGLGCVWKRRNRATA